MVRQKTKHKQQKTCMLIFDAFKLSVSADAFTTCFQYFKSRKAVYKNIKKPLTLVIRIN